MTLAERRRRAAAERLRQGAARRPNPARQPALSRALTIPFLALVALVLVIRAALPIVIEIALERRLLPNQVVGTFEIGDVDLSLVAGRLVLEDIAVYEDAGSEEPAGAPWLAIERLALRIARRPLLDQTVRVRHVEIVEPFVAVTRTENGLLDLQGRLRAQEPATDAGWTVLVEDGAIRGGRIRFLDLAVAPDERIRLDVERIDAERLALDPGDFERPGHAVVEGTIARAPFTLDVTIASATPADPANGAVAIAGPEGASVGPGPASALRMDATFDLHDFPVARTTVYMPAFHQRYGDVQGRADLHARFLHETGARTTLDGWAELRALQIAVENVQRPALSWERLRVEADMIDFRARRVALTDVRLTGGSLLLHVEPDLAVPLVAADAGGPPAADDAAAQVGDGTALPADDAPQLGGWAWSLASLDVKDSQLVITAPGRGAVTADVTASASDVGPAARFPVSIRIDSPQGRLEMQAEVVLAPMRVSGEVTIDDVGLPLVARAFAAGAPLTLESGTLAANLNFSVDGTEAASAGDDAAFDTFTASGAVRVDDLRLAPPPAGGKGLSVAAVAATIEAVVPLDPAADAESVLRIAELIVRRPEGDVLRTSVGVQLPWERMPDVPGAREPAMVEESAGDSVTAQDEAPAGSDGASRAVPAAATTLEIARVRVEDGVVHLEDRSIEPYFREQLRDVTFTARGVRWPPLNVERLELAFRGMGSQPVRIVGRADGEQIVLEGETSRVRLPPLNPYIATYSDYAVESGALSMDAEIEIDGRTWEADLDLRLHDFDLTAEGESFRQSFGVPLSLGMALLRDLRGDIVLSVPVAGDRKGVRTGILRALAGSMHRAVLNALTSPLKALGGVMRADGEGPAWEPAPIAFRPGTMQLTPQGARQLTDLGQVLAERPRLRVELRPLVTERLVAAERPDEEADDGWWDALTGGRAGDEAVDAGAQSPRALAQRRLRFVEDQLVRVHGVPADRVETVPKPATTSGTPGIDVAIAPEKG